jgi:hypothetical protein
MFSLQMFKRGERKWFDGIAGYNEVTGLPVDSSRQTQDRTRVSRTCGIGL